MIRQLLSVFKKNTLLDLAFSRSCEMLDITMEMFLEAKKSLRERDTNKLDMDVRARDIKVNKYEREVRRNVYNHLAVSGSEDVYFGLVLVSIIIDIERIGDYTKNIIELADNHPPRLKGGIYEDDLQKVEAAVEDTFRRIRHIFEQGDTHEAQKLVKEYLWLTHLCDDRVNDYIQERDKTISSGDAVTLAMYFRFLKRIYAHLRNIGTSVVNPFENIGFVPKSIKSTGK